MIRALAVACALLGAASQARAVDCKNIAFEQNRYTVCEADAGSEDLRLFLYGPQNNVLGQFGAIDGVLGENGEQLVFAMNAGMYHSDRSPVGLYVENGVELKGAVADPGPGNFGMVPNGVFCIREGRADVFETLTYLAQKPACRFATQSGPMLVIEGDLHPRFLPDSTSRYVRNGVGTGPEGRRVVFAISRNAVTFHEFGRLFRDGLGIDSALYFDGNISRLYAPELGRSDGGFALGPVVGIVAPR